jgi:hypothetical protein
VDLAVGRPIVPAHTGRAIGRSREHSIDGPRAHGAAFRSGRVLRCAQAQPSRVMARGERGKPARRRGTLGFRDKRCNSAVVPQHSVTVAGKPHPKSACLPQRSLDSPSYDVGSLLSRHTAARRSTPRTNSVLPSL